MSKFLLKKWEFIELDERRLEAKIVVFALFLANILHYNGFFAL